MSELDHRADGQASPAFASPALRAYQHGVMLICNTAFAIATVLVLVDLGLLGISIFARYMANSPITWGDELVALSLTAITVLAAPKVLLDKGHIEVDIITGSATGRLYVVIRLWSSVAVFLVAMLLIFNGWSLAMFSRLIGLLTEGHLELPLWMLQLLLPLGGILLLPVIILQFWQAITAWNHRDTETDYKSAESG